MCPSWTRVRHTFRVRRGNWELDKPRDVKVTFTVPRISRKLPGQVEAAPRSVDALFHTTNVSVGFK